jgi:hypothetical protein
MKTLFKFLRWIIRLLYILIVIINYNSIGVGFFDLSIYLIIDILASIVSLLRFETDSISEVVTGFFGDSDYGYYEVNSNLGARFIGNIFWVIALGSRGIMILFIVLYFL